MTTDELIKVAKELDSIEHFIRLLAEQARDESLSSENASKIIQQMYEWVSCGGGAGVEVNDG